MAFIHPIACTSHSLIPGKSTSSVMRVNSDAENIKTRSSTPLDLAWPPTQLAVGACRFSLGN